MRTTTRSSRRGAGAGIALLLAGWLSWGCAPKTDPTELFQLTPESAANRAMQTRHFETPNAEELLSASAAALQDLGFQVTESERALGFLRAAKERSAREYGQEITRGIVAVLSTVASALGGGNAGMVVLPVDLHQQINASLVARPLGSDEPRHEVRITFYRLVWRGDGMDGNRHIPPGEQRMEMIRDAELFQQFFARLSKAVFLEAERI